MGRVKTPDWVPKGYKLEHDPTGYAPHVHEREPLPGTPEGAQVECRECGAVLVAKNTQQGFVWTLAPYRLVG